MKNTLGDLNNHLFAQLERLGDEEITGEQLVEEMKRAKSIAMVANQVIKNAALVLEAQKVYEKQKEMNIDVEKPKMLEG